MVFRFLDAIKYVDNLVGIATAVLAYVGHKDESVLADAVLKQLMDAVNETVGIPPGLIDEEKIRQGIVNVIDGLEGVF